MIHGIGTDIVSIPRLTRIWQRHGQHFADRILTPDENLELRRLLQQRLPGTAQTPSPANAEMVGRFLGKRFAAKEAFAKALGTGVRAPAVLTAIGVAHDKLGKPHLQFATRLAGHLGQLARDSNKQQLVAHLSISDEKEQALAFVILEYL